MTIVLQFYPNGEFSQGVDTSRSRPLKYDRKATQTSLTNAEITEHDLLICKQQTAEMGAQIYGQKGTNFTDRGGNTFTLVETGDDYCVLTGFSNYTETGTERVDTSIYRLVHLGILSPLVHQSVESCENPESRKKLLSMTKKMSRNIRNAVYLLEQKPGGKDVLSFLTLTLPNLSTEGLQSCCQNWDFMVKRFLDWLRIRLKNAGIQLEHVYCTEIQTKRLTNRGEYAPHLHIIYRGRKSKKAPWAISPKQARSEWARCIRAYVDEQFSTSALENLQRIKYSAARYLSKYLSKGCQSIPCDDGGQAVECLKTQWGGMARTLSQSVRKNTHRFRGEGEERHIALSIMDCMGKLIDNGLVLYFKKGLILLGIDKTTGLEYGLHVGCGCLRTPTYQSGLIEIMDFIYAINVDMDCYDE